jgi:hypothetical protein
MAEFARCFHEPPKRGLEALAAGRRVAGLVPGELAGETPTPPEEVRGQGKKSLEPIGESDIVASVRSGHLQAEANRNCQWLEPEILLRDNT